jgi:PAS domain S-box-containing protein
MKDESKVRATSSASSRALPSRVRRYSIIIAAIWTLLIASLGLWDARRSRQIQQELIYQEARTNLRKDLGFRHWAASHGGIYVPETDHTPASPYLKHIPERDITSPGGQKLTLMNPAYMLRQMMEDFEELVGIKSRITSLNPLRPENEPDEWERKALETFERGSREFGEFSEIGGERYLRLMHPIMVEQSCLKCHEHQGYRVGDVRGGVDVSVSAAPYLAQARSTLVNHSFGLGLLWLVGLMGITLASRRIQSGVRARNLAEIEREEARTFLQTVIDGIPDSLMVVNRDFTIALANRRASAIAGDDGLISVPPRCHEVSHASAVPCAENGEICPMERVLESRSPLTVEHEHQDANGMRHSVEIIAAPILDEAGEVVQIIESSRDISDRRKAEEVRAEHLRFLEKMNQLDRVIQQATDLEEMMSSALETVREIFGADRAWLLYPCDPEAETWSVPMERTRPEYPGALAIGKEIPMLPEAKSLMSKALADGSVLTSYPGDQDAPQDSNERFAVLAQIFMAIHPPTRKPWLFGLHQCSHHREWDEEEKTLFREIGRRLGDALGIMLSMHDLKASQERWRSLTMNSPDQVMQIDFDGTIRFINHPVPGLTIEEMLGSSVFEHMPQETHQEAADCFGTVRGTGAVESYETEYHDESEGVSYFDTQVSPIISDGEITGLIQTTRNVSERKRVLEEKLTLERQMQHAQKLESLGVLAGGIAHDFNNLLMAILGNASLALDELQSMAPARGNILEIEKASKRAAELAKQMLAYSGKGRFVIEPVAANELIEEMGHLLEVSISKKALLKYNFADNLPSFDGDVTQIRQIIMNLITNASEAIDDKSGIIALSTGAMHCDRAYLDKIMDTLGISSIEPLAEGVYVYFEVADTGCGMDQETMSKVFDPFFSMKFTGRGLGMSAVLGIVRGHGGAIKVYSELRKGTTFKVLFPVSKDSDDLHRIPRRAASNWDEVSVTGTILIADDEETVCAVGKQMLERLGFEALTAPDGREALELFREHGDGITCVLLDLTMPHMDGEEAFREMRQLKPDVQVILCSGYNEQDATQRFVGKGLAGFLQKPYTMAELQEKLVPIVKS